MVRRFKTCRCRKPGEISGSERERSYGLIIEERVDVRLHHAGRESGFPISEFPVGTMEVLIVLAFDDPILTVGPQLSNFFMLHEVRPPCLEKFSRGEINVLCGCERVF